MTRAIPPAPSSAPTRRGLLIGSLAALACLGPAAQAQQVIRGSLADAPEASGEPEPAPAAAADAADPEVLLADLAERRLVLYSTHRQDRLDVAYWRDGDYDAVALALTYYFLRDHYDNSVHLMDHRLLNVLCALQQSADGECLHVLSAYRSARTNAALHRIDPVGVAWRSLHLQGRAIDIRIPDRGLAGLRRMAIECGAGGLGYYPQSGFVHVDTGPRRNWSA